MKQATKLTAAALLVAFLTPAFADDPVFPPGVRTGIAPMIGLVPAKGFPGFETADHRVTVLINELPASAFRDVENASKANAVSSSGVKPEGLDTAAGQSYYIVENAKDGTDNVRRYSMIVAGPNFSGYVAMQVPENVEKIYSDDAVRKMFATVVVRKEVPVEEQLGLLPFKLTELGSFKTVRTLAPGAAILLSDSEEDTGLDSAAFMVLGLIGSAPDKPEDRSRFAQQVATTLPGLRDAHITMSEPIRINSSAGFETRIDATSGKSNTPVTVVQWLVFGSGNSAVRIVGSTPKDEWAAAFPRFRAVRDGIQPR